MSDHPPAGAPRVSVVIPVYNAEPFLAVALDSVFAQTFEDFVVLAVDDGSTDRSLEILKAYVDPRLRVIEQPNSGGPARPRNAGIAATRTELVALLDADDVMMSDKLERQVAALDRFPEAGFAFSNFGRIDQSGRSLTDSFLAEYDTLHELVDAHGEASGDAFIPSDRLFTGLCKANFVGTSSVVLRRTALDQVGTFDESLHNSDDRDLWFRLARRFGGVYTPRVLHQYRDQPNSITERGFRRNAESRLQVLKRQLELGVTPEERRELQRWIAGIYGNLGYAERDAGNRWASVQAFLRSFVLRPQPRTALRALKSVVSVRDDKQRTG